MLGWGVCSLWELHHAWCRGRWKVGCGWSCGCVGTGSVPDAETCIGFPIQMSSWKINFGGMWWSHGCAPCAAQLGPFCALLCSGSISDRLLLNERRGMVHQTPLLRTRQKFHPPQNADTLKMQGAPRLLASSLCNLPSGDVCAVRVDLHVAARGWSSCPWSSLQIHVQMASWNRVCIINNFSRLVTYIEGGV